VRANFSEWRDVRIVVGAIPESLAEADPDTVAFLHLDMNCAPPEATAAEYFWDRLVPGAFILMDDYGYVGSDEQRIALDFGDTTISSEEQAYIRYDSMDRSFLFVPNLSKTNIVAINDKKPTGAVKLELMDVITMGRTQLAFVAFCGEEFDWSELSDLKE